VSLYPLDRHSKCSVIMSYGKKFTATVYIFCLSIFRHDLPLINIMNKDASINDNGGTYAGLDRFVCRDKLWADMEAAGLTIKVDPHMQRVPRSQR
jgi:tRNA synthetases class I (I, L, M and V)